MNCPHCKKHISRSDIAKSIADQGAGRKMEPKPCEFCGKLFGSVEMRRHLPRCKQNPEATLIGVKYLPRAERTKVA